MGRIERITRRVATAEVVAVSFFLAKERPSDLFGAVFFDIREKAKKLKTQWEDQAVTGIQRALIEDLTKNRGLSVVDFKLSLGKYRGSRFVTSAKLKVKVDTEQQAQELLKHLQTKFSPKYKLKNFDSESGVASYNVR